MGCCTFAKLKSSLVLLNILYMLIALILIAVPAFAYGMNYFTSYSLIGSLIGAGVFLFLFSFLGLCGALHHHQVVLFFYMVVLGLLCIVQFASSITLVAINDQQRDNILNKSWVHATNSSRNEVQEAFDCCGFDHNVTDSILPPVNCSALPCCTSLYKTNETECFKPEDIDDTEDIVTKEDDTHTIAGCDSCKDKVSEQFSYAVKVSGAVGLFFSFTELIGIILAIQYRNTKDPSRNYSFPGHTGFAK